LRRRISEYEDETGINLIEHCFKDVTRAQAVKFNIKGNSVRMDSKLIGSNIARYSRYRIVLTTLQKWAINGIFSLNPSLKKKLKPYLDEDAQKTEYRSTSDEIQQKIESLGSLIYKILVRIKATDGLLLNRVFNEQYEVYHGKVALRDKKRISADSVQNPNDPDAGYRTKGDQSIKGYSVNATETNDEDGKPSLITDVQVKSATAADKDFLERGIEGSAEVTGTLAEHVNADGAYQSDGNRDFAADNLIDFVTSGLQGKPSRYDLTLNDDGLTVVDKATGDVIPVTRAKDKWRIATDSKAKYRYFTPEQVEKALLRKRLEAIPKKELDRRNNVRIMDDENIKCEDMETSILRTAKRLFLQNGFEETTMSMIAMEMGVNRPTLHYYFRTKDKMFQAVFGSIIQSLLPKIHETITNTDRDITDRIGDMVNIYYAILKDEPTLPLFIVREIQRDLQHLLNTIYDTHNDNFFFSITESLKSEMESGKIKKIPLPFVFYTFYGLVMTPFLTMNLGTMVFSKYSGPFDALITKWKPYIVNQMTSLLKS
jgi:AcrR family transcriptional regulator